MLDVSPEKLLALFAVALVVLGPQRLPGAARGLGRGLSTARRLAQGLTQPLHDSLAEPRRAAESALSDVRYGISGVAANARPAGPDGATAGPPPRVPTDPWLN